MKQEEIQEDEWNSCGGSRRDDSTNAEQQPTSGSNHLAVVCTISTSFISVGLLELLNSVTLQNVIHSHLQDTARGKVNSSQLKEESLRNVQEHPEKWSLCMEGECLTENDLSQQS